MKNKNSVIIGVVVVLVLVIGGFLISRQGPAPATDLAPNNDTAAQAPEPQAPERQLRDAPVDIEFKNFAGNTVTLSQFEGTPLVVNSWATWCPFCVDELPDFATVQEEFGDDIKIIAIDRAESLKQSQKFTDNLGITDKLTFLVDGGDRFYATIGGFSMPETVFITPDGKIAFHKRGPMTVEEMRTLINEHLLN